MDLRPLGRTGLTVSALGFGCGNVGGLMIRGSVAEQRAAVARAIDSGITYFDTAPSYGDGRSEENLGRALRDLGAHERVVVGTKVRLAPEELAAPGEAVRRSLEASLRRLGRERVDLLQLHNPIGAGSLPVEEALAGVADGMRQVIAAGLARCAGFTGIGETAALKRMIASGSFDTVQAYFNAANPSAGFPGAAAGGHDFGGLIDDAARAGMGVLAIRVLAAGALSGTAERAPLASPVGRGLVPGGDFADDLARTTRLAGIAAEGGLESTVELAVRFALSKPGVSTALVGLSAQEQLEAALRWADRGPLPTSVVERVVAVAR